MKRPTTWGGVWPAVSLGRRHAVRLALGATLVVLVGSATAQESSRAAVEQLVASIVRQTAAVCPLVSPSDQTALDRCREGLYRDSALRRSLAPIVLWGRPSPEGKRIKETMLTQFAPDVLSGLYLPMFMFTEQVDLAFDPRERLYRVRVSALFRNGLDPGQYPYPFWHDSRKWADYQAANELTLWIEPSKLKVVAMQFSAQGRPDPRLKSPPRTPPPFDGQWMWRDEAGRAQPQPTLFIGLLRADNPYLGRVEGAYRDLAGALRKGTCHECHSPDNPQRMKRLVLMQTPVHAAGEIKRIMSAVREDKMPVDDTEIYKELDADVKATLLNLGAAFESLIDEARDWESRNR